MNDFTVRDYVKPPHMRGTTKFQWFCSLWTLLYFYWNTVKKKVSILHVLIEFCRFRYPCFSGPSYCFNCRLTMKFVYRLLGEAAEECFYRSIRLQFVWEKAPACNPSLHSAFEIRRWGSILLDSVVVKLQAGMTAAKDISFVGQLGVTVIWICISLSILIGFVLAFLSHFGRLYLKSSTFDTCYE